MRRTSISRPTQLAGVVRWMLVRVVRWPTRYRAEALAPDYWRPRSLAESIHLLAADAQAELGVEPSGALDLAAERVWVWAGRGRITSRTYAKALAALPLVVVRRATEDGRLERHQTTTR